jgi:hypothetical protein
MKPTGNRDETRASARAQTNVRPWRLVARASAAHEDGNLDDIGVTVRSAGILPNRSENHFYATKTSST